MITYEKIDEHTVKITTTSENFIDTRPLSLRLEQINKELESLDKEPDEVLEPNFRKFNQTEMLGTEKAEIEKTLEALNG